MTHQPIPADELRAIRERCEKATKGPWGYRDYSFWSNGSRIVAPTWNADLKVKREDVEFITNARTDVPRLLDAYESALGEIERLLKVLEEIENHEDNIPDDLDFLERQCLRASAYEDVLEISRKAREGDSNG